jgi:DNA-binding SARP family transcriptional activator/ABC-type transport system substrate-binding protein/streptogramin lyase
MEFRLLGPVEAVRDGRSVPLGGAKPRALLALLLLHPNEVVSRDRLIEALWPKRTPGTAAHSLDVQVSRLRKAFEPDALLVTRAGGYVLDIERETIDAHRFERLVEFGRRANAAGRPHDALTELEAALGLWRGEAFGDLAYEEWARTESDRLEELRLGATEERIDAALALGQHGAVVAELEALTTKHPLRERLRGQLMLALYRSGRQAEALRVYADSRKLLVDELGLEPGQPLKDLEQAILRQDAALELPRTPRQTRRVRALVGVGALVLAAGVVAVAVGLTQGGTESAKALAAPDSNVFVSAATGDLVRASPVRDTVRVAYDKGALWSISSRGDLTRLDSTTGKEVATLGLGIKPAGLAVGDGSVWVTERNSPTLFRIDPSVNEKLDPFELPMKRVVTDGTGEVVVGGGSVWVGHGAFNPGAVVERLDPETGRVQHRFSILAGDVDHLAFGEGALWVASSPGQLRKIDPRTNKVVFTRTLQSELCCVAVGGGYAWAASNPEGVVWKVTTNGTVLPTIKLSSPVQTLTFADGALWAALGDAGTVVRIDPTTDATREYELGHSVTSVDVRNGLIAAGVRHRIEDVTGDLSGDVIWVGRKGRELFDSGAPVEPAFATPNWDAPQAMFHYMTCAKLLNYADAEGETGRRLVPDVAKELPEVSDGGRTWTFRIRKGFGFSPPSTQEVTAESFRHAAERQVELTKLFGDDLGPPLSNIVGARAYYAGTARHISGMSPEGDELVIRLLEPAPDMPWLTAASSCAVPVPTPVVDGGLEKPVPSAGPCDRDGLTDSLAVLRKNPNYGGSRPQNVDAIVVEFSVPPSDAVTRIENGTLDYFFESQHATLTPGTDAARAAGSRYRVTPYNRIQYFAFNYDRALFSDRSMRRAVQFALDRSALVASSPSGTTALPATRLLYPSTLGYDARQLYPLRSDLRTARRLAAGRGGRVVVCCTFVGDAENAESFNLALREQLAAIGLRMKTLWIRQGAPESKVLAKVLQSDLIWGGLNNHTADPAEYLKSLFLPPKEATELRRIQTLLSPERERAALALARRIERESLYAVYQIDGMPELLSKRLSCVVHQPEYAGVDLAAACLKSSSD